MMPFYLGDSENPIVLAKGGILYFFVGNIEKGLIEKVCNYQVCLGPGIDTNYCDPITLVVEQDPNCNGVYLNITYQNLLPN